jgi:hypothetical protein
LSHIWEFKHFPFLHVTFNEQQNILPTVSFIEISSFWQAKCFDEDNNQKNLSRFSHNFGQFLINVSHKTKTFCLIKASGKFKFKFKLLLAVSSAVDRRLFWWVQSVFIF